MRNHVYVRSWRKTDVPLFLTWSQNTEDNLFDPDVATYNTTVVRCAYDQDGPMVFMPVQQPLFMEHLAIRPGLSDTNTAVALKELTQDTVSQAHIKGSGEIYFLCKEPSTIAFAKHQLFEEVPWRLFRIKLKELETPRKESDEADSPTGNPPSPSSVQ